MATQQEVIKAFMKALDNHTLKKGNNETDDAFTKRILDAAIKECSSFSSAQAVINQMLQDCKSYNEADSGSGWEDFLLEKCGINLDNLDTGAITGSDAGGSKVKTAESIVPENASLKKFEGNSFTVNGLTVVLGEDGSGNSTVARDFDDLSEQEKYIWQSLYSYWIKNGLNLISESYGNNFSFTKEKSSTGTSNPATKTLYIVFDQTKKYSGLTYYAHDWNSFGLQKPTKGLAIGISMHYFGEATGVNGEADNGIYSLDRLVAHELTHAVMKANVDYFDYLPAFIKEGMAELTIGIDDENYSGIKKMASNSAYLKKALSLSDYSTIDIDNVQDPTYAAGYMFLRYLAKQVSTKGKSLSNSTKNKTMTGTAEADTLKNYADNVTINALAGNDYIKNSGGDNVTISGGNGADQIYAYGNKISINTGKDDDFAYLYRNASNVTVVASEGNNEIHSSAQTALINAGNGNNYVELYKQATNTTVTTGTGKDKIYSAAQTALINAGAGNDYIKNSGGNNVSISGGDGADQIYAYGNKISINTGKDDDFAYLYKNASNVTVVASEGNNEIHSAAQTALINAGNGNNYVELYKQATNTTVTTGTGKDKIYSAAQTALINAGAGNDYLCIYSSATKNTITAGTGNDTIENYGKNALFNYKAGDGNDKIIGFNDTSTLSISGSAYTTVKSGSDIIFTVGKEKVTLQGTAKLSKVNVKSGINKIDNRSSKVSVNGGEGIDSVYSSGSNVTIKVLGGNDTVSNFGSNVKIYGGAGDDSLYSHSNKSSVLIDTGAGNNYVRNFSSNVTILGSDGKDTIYNDDDCNKATIKSGAGNDSVRNIGTAVTIDLGAGNDSLSNENANVTISGGKGNDYIYNYSSGKNVLFKYASGDGNDKIIGFNATSTLSISSGTYTSQKSGSDIFVTVGNGKLTLTGAANLSKVNIAGTKTATLLTVTNSTKSPVTVGSSIKVIDASKRTTAVKITGNSLANTITGGSNKDTIYGENGNDSILGNAGNDSLFGGKGNDTLNGGAGHDSMSGGDGHDELWGGAGNDILWGGNGADKLYGQNGNDELIGSAGNDILTGGKGNDSLWGDAGKDIFIYDNGDGQDVIYEFANDDMLKITGAFSGTYNKSKKEVYFKVGSTKNAITLKNYSATTFNVNGTNYKISGSKLK